jgi:hypothetical protein
MGKRINSSMKNAFILLLLFTSYCCKDYRNIGSTPSKYKYKVNKTAKASYSIDTTAIRPILTKMLDKQIKPLDLKPYDKGTDLFIDSLVYSPDQLRMIVFVIVKNSTMKLLRRENDSTYYYDAYYLFCSRESLSMPMKVFNYSGYRLSRFYDHSEIRDALREYCFNRLLKLDGTEQHYNIDDVRFWRSKDFEWVLKNSTATSE